MRLIFAYCAAVLAAWVLLEHAAAPYVWIALLFVLVSGFSFRRSRSVAAKMMWINLAAAVAFLGVYEGYLTVGQGPLLHYDDSRGYRWGTYFERDAVTGYSAKPSARISVARFAGDALIYDVTHTVDEHGLRISPPVRSDAALRGCVWFFGGSYTFGEGVNDDEAMPYRVGVRSGGAYRVRNFGFHGHGPHQMLAELQSGRSEARAGCKPTHVVYQGLVWHALRATGHGSWDRFGPYYILDAQGRPVRAGTFEDLDLGRPSEEILKRLERSQIYRKHLAKYVDPYQHPIGPRDVGMMTAIVIESAAEVARRFPGARFHVVLWDVDFAPYADEILRTLVASGIAVHPISRVIPNYGSPSAPPYRLPHDAHPNAAAHDRIAAYVVREILGADSP